MASAGNRLNFSEPFLDGAFRFRVAPKPTFSLLFLLLSAGAFVPPVSAQEADTVAQDFPLTVPAEFLSFSGGDCRASSPPALSFSWNLSEALDPSDEMEVFVSKSAQCSSADLVLVDRSRVNSREHYFPLSGESLNARELFDLFGSDCGGDAGISETVTLCARYHSQNIYGGSTELLSTEQILLDSRAPGTPKDLKAIALDGGLLLRWKPGSGGDAERHEVEVWEDESDSKPLVSKFFAGGDRSEAEVFDLENGKTYRVRLRAWDDAGSATRSDTFGNSSEFTEMVDGTPQEVEDFFSRYQRLGGAETGGCSSTGSGPFAWLMGLVLLFSGVFRRISWLRSASHSRAGAKLKGLKSGNKSVLLGVLCLSVLLPTQKLSAEPMQWQQSPQHFWLDVRTGPYQPGIDSEPGLSGSPYKDMFGNKHPLLTRVECGVDVFGSFGRLGLGVAAAYWGVNGKGRYPNDGDKVAEDAVSLTLWPVSPVLNYRFDLFWQRWNVPLIPYAKVGYGLAHWSSRVSGKVPEVGGNKAQGFAHGFEWAAGLQVALNFLDPSTAAAFDQQVGVNLSAIYVEVLGNHWKGAHGLELGGTSWGAGLHFGF